MPTLLTSRPAKLGCRHVSSALAIAVAAWLASSCSPQSGAHHHEQTPGSPVVGSGAGASGGAATGGASAGSGGAASHAPAGGGAGHAGVNGVSGVGGDGAGTSGAAGETAGAGGSSDDAGIADGGPVTPTLPPADSVDADGPFETTQDLGAGPSGDSGLFYPTDLGRDGLAHPIFVWGCGGGSTPSSYATHLNRIASHGFIVIAEVSTIGNDGAILIAALEWLIAENERPESMFFGKLDTAKVAAGGHSIGSVNTFLIADDPRLTTTIHVAGGSLDDVNDPFAPTTGLGGKGLVHPAAYICSESDVFGNVEKTEADYAVTTVPVFFTIMTGADHVGAASEGLPAIVAWLRWHLGGETERSAMFLDPGGEFQTGKYVSRTKNW